MKSFARFSTFALPIAAIALASACSVKESASSSSTSTSTTSPTLELSVYAATSTRDALQALAPEFEKAHSAKLVFNFGSSGDLAKQIVAAAKADVFLSADDKAMDDVDAAKLVAPGSRRELLSNQLVVVERADAPSIFNAPFDAKELADARLAHLSLANVESVPAGRYAKAWLDKHGVWKDVAERVVPGVDVRAALAAVESAAAGAGIVYKTDAARSKKVRIVFEVPIADGPAISYPIAAIAGRANERDSRALIEFFASSSAQKTFESFGFAVVAPKSN